jgi:hypothetical protein
MTVAEFCDLEQVSVANFYRWRRKLAAGAQRWLEQKSRRALRAVTRRAAQDQQVDELRAFVPVRIDAGTVVELHLPNGSRVCIPSQELSAIAAAVTAAGQLSVEQPATGQRAAGPPPTGRSSSGRVEEADPC